MNGDRQKACAISEWRALSVNGVSILVNAVRNSGMCRAIRKFVCAICEWVAQSMNVMEEVLMWCMKCECRVQIFSVMQKS